jgi:diacylglycerol O-acyltransferase
VGSPQFGDRMSSTDATMWVIEKDPLLRSTIVGVVLLDRPADREALTRVWERASRAVVRLRQRVVSDPYSVAPPLWQVDPQFDLGYHVRFVKTVGDGTMRDLLDLVGPIGMQSFDRARPLWEVVGVEGLAEGRGALIFKLHHSMTDGIGFVNLATEFFDDQANGWEQRQPLPDPPAATIPSASRRFSSGIAHEMGEAGDAARKAATAAVVNGVGMLRNPIASLRDVSATTTSIARVLRPTLEPLSPIMRDRSLGRRFDVLDSSLDELKAAAKSVEGRMNDAFVAATFGGLRRYHLKHDALVDGLRMNMPVNIRGSGDLAVGNHFAPMRFVVPLDIADPAERMRVVHQLVHDVRAEPALGLVGPISAVLYRLGTSVATAAFNSMMRGVDVVTTNVPGTPFDIHFAGSRVESLYAFAPLAGAAMNVALFSYKDRVHVGVCTDSAAVPDPDVLMVCLREGFEEVCAIGR